MQKFIDWLKTAWRYLVIIVSLIAAFLGGLATAFALGRKRKDVHGSGVGTDSSGLPGAIEQLGKLEANQQSADRRNSELANAIDGSKTSADAIDGNNQKLANGIDDAQAKLDKLGADLGIK